MSQDDNDNNDDPMLGSRVRVGSYRGCIRCYDGDVKDGVCNNPDCPSNKTISMESSSSRVQASSYVDNTTCPVCNQTFPSHQYSGHNCR